MKEEIERRRAEAAERRQKVEDDVDGSANKPFMCVSPRGSSLKVSSHSFSPPLPCFFFFLCQCTDCLTGTRRLHQCTLCCLDRLMRGRTAYQNEAKIVSRKSVLYVCECLSVAIRSGCICSNVIWLKALLWFVHISHIKKMKRPNTELCIVYLI